MPLPVDHGCCLIINLSILLVANTSCQHGDKHVTCIGCPNGVGVCMCVAAEQEQLNSAMSNLMTDNDRDVAHAARCLHATFKRTPLRMTGGAGLLDMNGSSSGTGARWWLVVASHANII